MNQRAFYLILISGLTLCITFGIYSFALPTVTVVSASGASSTCLARVASNGTVYTDVQTAVNVALPADLIQIAGQCTGVQSQGGMTQTVYISQSLALQGGYDGVDWDVSDPIQFPTTLDANGLGRVVVITDTAHVTISNLTIQGGYIVGSNGINGAGVFISADNDVAIVNTTIISNMVEATIFGIYGGGGVYNRGTLSIADVLFFANHGGYDGGAIFNDRGTIHLTNVQIDNNSSEFAGDALYNAAGHILLEQSSVTNNRGANWGAINNIGESAVMTLSQSTVSHHSEGLIRTIGAIDNEAGRLTILDSSFTHNEVAGVLGISSAIRNRDGQVHIERSEFEHNLLGDTITNYGNLSIVSTIFNRNTVDAYGQAVVKSAGLSSTLHLGKVVIQNTLGLMFSSIDIVKVEQGEALIEDSILQNNELLRYLATDVTIEPDASVVISNSTVFNPGIIGNDGNTTIHNSIFSTLGNDGDTTVHNSTFNGLVNNGTSFLENSTLTNAFVAGEGQTTFVHSTLEGLSLWDLSSSAPLTASNSIFLFRDDRSCINQDGMELSITGTLSLTNVDDCDGFIQNDNIFLGALADNGGATPTFALLPESDAIDMGDCHGGTITTDQRGVARPQHEACDIGAYEFDGALTPIVDIAPALQMIDEETVFVDLTVSLSFAFTETVTVDVAIVATDATEGEDFIFPSQPLTFTAGMTTHQVTVAILDDVLVESDESIEFGLVNPVNGRIGNATSEIIIMDNDFGIYLPLLAKP